MATTSAVAEAPKEIRIGLLGCGFMGKCHTNAYKKIPYIYAAAKIKPRLAVLCDAKTELAKQEAARYGYEAFCSSWEELAADPRIDVFDNCARIRCIPSRASPL